LAATVAVLVALFKGGARNPIPDGDGGFTKGRFTLKLGAKRRAGLTVLFAALVLPALVITPPGHRAVIYNLGGGVNPVERGEGLSLVVPYVQTARMVNIRTQVFLAEVLPQSSDLQEVTVPIAANFHVNGTRAAELYQSVGLAYTETVIAPAVFQLVTQEVGQFKAIDFAKSRALLAKAVHTALRDRLSKYGIIVESVNIKDAIFQPEFRTAVQNKIIAEQKAAEAQRLIEVATAEAQAVRERAAGDRDAAIFRAEGQRQAIADVAAALGFTPAEYLRWVILTAWNGLLPSTLVGDAGEFGLLLTPNSQPPVVTP
jgi:regulator of protease activity HflC (stomatin/prohibitin superfamily)